MPFQFHAVPLRAPSCEGFMSPIRSFQFQFFRFHVQAGRKLKRILGLCPAAVFPILGFFIHGNFFIPIVAKSIHANTFRYLIQSVSFYAVSIVRFSCVLGSQLKYFIKTWLNPISATSPSVAFCANTMKPKVCIVSKIYLDFF